MLTSECGRRANPRTDIIGTNAAELVHIGQCAIAFKATADYFVDTVFNYPTLAECYKIVALSGLNKLGNICSPAAAPRQTCLELGAPLL